MAQHRTLPPELLLIIIEMIIAACADPIEQCEVLTFPKFNEQLRSGCVDKLFSHPWLLNLCLACRTFKNLVESRWPYQVIKKTDVTIRRSAKSLFIDGSVNSGAVLQHILNCSVPLFNVISLDFTFRYPVSPVWTPIRTFDTLCRCAHLLPNVRSLILEIDIDKSPRFDGFWGRLNTAFPRLICLVFNGSSPDLHNGELVTFRELRILDLDRFNINTDVEFPLLRHASLAWGSPYEMQLVEGWRLLESLLLPDLWEDPLVEWTKFPYMHTLGMSRRHLAAYTGPPAHHPLRNLYVYIDVILPSEAPTREVQYERQLVWFKGTLQRFPSIAQVTLAFEKNGTPATRWIRGDFVKEDLEPLGFAVVNSEGEVLRDDEPIVIKRMG